MNKSWVIVLSSEPSLEVLLAAWVLQKFGRKKYEGIENARYVFVRPNSDVRLLQEPSQEIEYFRLEGDVEYLSGSLSRRVLREIGEHTDTYLEAVLRYLEQTEHVFPSVLYHLHDAWKQHPQPASFSEILNLIFLVLDRLYYYQSVKDVSEVLQTMGVIKRGLMVTLLSRTRKGRLKAALLRRLCPVHRL